MLHPDAHQPALDPAESQRLALRRVLMWGHVITAFVMLLFYLAHVDLTRFPWWHGSAGIWAVLIGVPVLVPYVISAGYSRSLYSDPAVCASRLRVAAFVAVLFAGAIMMAAVIAGAFGSISGFLLLQLLLLQTVGYGWA